MVEGFHSPEEVHEDTSFFSRRGFNFPDNVRESTDSLRNSTLSTQHKHAQGGRAQKCATCKVFWREKDRLNGHVSHDLLVFRPFTAQWDTAPFFSFPFMLYGKDKGPNSGRVLISTG